LIRFYYDFWVHTIDRLNLTLKVIPKMNVYTHVHRLSMENYLDRSREFSKLC